METAHGSGTGWRETADNGPPRESGAVAEMAAALDPGCRETYLGGLLSIGYDELTIATCDAWKLACGGVPRNSFVLVKASPEVVGGGEQCERLILARVTDGVPTPVQRDVDETVFQLHKSGSTPDPLTGQELRWSGLEAKILGTFYDVESAEPAFGSDLAGVLSPHCYEAYVPMSADLEKLVNGCVRGREKLELGTLRYTETPPMEAGGELPVLVTLDDVVGTRHDGRRTALFGMTRYGKSNIVKVLADRIISSERKAGGVVFDASGEYSYVNSQDGTSLYAMHPECCVRYSISPRELAAEQKRGLPEPKSLKVNFYDSVPVGHALIRELWEVYHDRMPNYVKPVFGWESPDLSEAPNFRDDPSGHQHFWRSMGMWFALLRLSDFPAPDDERRVPVDFRRPVKEALVEKLDGVVDADADGKLKLRQPLRVLPALFRELAGLWEQHGEDREWFGTSDGTPYFNGFEQAMLKILRDDGSISGKEYLQPFRAYHDSGGSDTFREISEAAQAGKTVLVDFARAEERVRANLSERVCSRLLSDMQRRLREDTLGDDMVVLYFEEAHELFPADDKDLTSVYNELAKEGAKANVSLLYATQSVTSISPDLLGNTDNVIVAHLEDDREVRELAHRRNFRDVAQAVETIRSKGYVWMQTYSHPFALPVQVRKFGEPDSGEGG